MTREEMQRELEQLYHDVDIISACYGSDSAETYYARERIKELRGRLAETETKG